MFDCGSVRVFVYRLFAVREDSGSRNFALVGRDDEISSSGSDSQVGDKEEKKCKKGIRIYFANKTKVKKYI